MLVRYHGSAVLSLQRVAWRRGASLSGRVGVGEYAIECMKLRAITGEGTCMACGVQITECIAPGVLVVGGGANMGFARAMMKAWTPATSGAGGSDSPPDRFN